MEIVRVDGEVHKVAQRKATDSWATKAGNSLLGARTEVSIRQQLLLTQPRSFWERFLRAWRRVPDSILMAERVEYDESRDSGAQVARIVMQPLAVPELSSLCGQPDMTTEACAAIVRRVTLALNFLHHHHTIHFDVACENIGLLREGDYSSAVLYDFTHSRPTWHILMDGEHSRLKYASLWESGGSELRPRIDFEQLFYCAVRLVHGQLPWDHLLTIEDDDGRERLVTKAKLEFAPHHAFLVEFKGALRTTIPGHVTPASESNIFTSRILAACDAATRTP